MKIDKSYISNNNSYPGQNPAYIVIHNTDNFRAGADAKCHAKAQHDGNFDGYSAHVYVDDTDTAYQATPYDRGAWHIGVNYGGRLFGIANNRNAIGIEMCVQAGYNYERAFLNTVEVCKQIMQQTGIDADHVISHYDACGKNCPSQIRANGQWNRFKRLITAEAKDVSWYRVRKTWADADSQIGAYEYLENAKAVCPSGYGIYDDNGKEIYRNTTVDSYTGETENIWMGWTRRETGSAGLRCIHGDAGKAYGLQFDYRYGLIPFMQYCVNYNPTRYAGFNQFIKLGAGNSALIYNAALGSLWQRYYDSYTEEFEQLQLTCAYQQYYKPARDYVYKNYGLNIDKRHPAVKGTLWSMAFRSGTETGAKKFAGCKDKSDEQILNTVYSTYGSQDRGRWTKAGQWGDALAALKNDTFSVVHKDMTKDESKPADSKPAEDSGKITKISEWLKIIQDWEKEMIKVQAVYSNHKNKTNYKQALKQNPVTTNCALFVTHALQQAGLFGSGDKFYGDKGTTIKGSAAGKLKNFAKITTYNKANVTADKIDLPIGAIVTWHEGHTNVYLGKDKNGKMQWSDAGRGTSIKGCENSAWKSFRKTGAMTGFHVANVIALNLIADVTEPTTKTEFEVRVTADDLRIREKPSLQADVMGYTGKGVFHITETQDGWGKLLSGAGWIYLNLNCVQRI